MKSTWVIIDNERGLHATPACMLAQTAMQFKSRIAITFNDRVINGKSLVHVVSLGAKKGDKLGFSVHGDDEEKALAALVDLIKVRNFDGE